MTPFRLAPRRARAPLLNLRRLMLMRSLLSFAIGVEASVVISGVRVVLRRAVVHRERRLRSRRIAFFFGNLLVERGNLNLLGRRLLLLGLLLRTFRRGRVFVKEGEVVKLLRAPLALEVRERRRDPGACLREHGPADGSRGGFVDGADRRVDFIPPDADALVVLIPEALEPVEKDGGELAVVSQPRAGDAGILRVVLVLNGRRFTFRTRVGLAPLLHQRHELDLRLGHFPFVSLQPLEHLAFHGLHVLQ